MNIKMKEKEKNNLKNKIDLKDLLVMKNKASFKSKNINIQTFMIDRNLNNFYSDKNFFSTKNIKNIYLHNSSLKNYNIVTKNDYFLKKNRNSFFNSFDSERVPSPINSVGSSKYIPSGKKKLRKRKYHNQIIQKKNRYKNIDKNDSLHNLSFNTNTNTYSNISYIYSSSSSSENEYDNDYSDSSEASYKSREDKRKKYFDKMMVEENELDYLKRSEVGLVSTDEEDNNNSMENSISIEENFNNEIERILIEIYNKNISLISSGNCNEISKNNGEIEDVERQIKKYLKRENLKTNLLVLKSLGNKIKELMDLWRDFISVVCNDCGKRLILKKESNYVVCTNCKSTILIEKDVVGSVPVEYSNLTSKEYYLLLTKEKSFNPYLFPKDSKYNLEPDFEKKLKF